MKRSIHTNHIYKSRKKSIEDVLNTSSKQDKKTHQSKFEYISLIISHWSQFFMFLVITIGYFYTVQPVFQKELIAEENAQLNIKKKELEEQIQEQQQRMVKLDQESMNINKSLQGLKNEVEKKTKELKEVTQQAESAKAQVIVARASLNEVSEKLYKELKQNMTGEKEISLEFSSLIKISFKFDIFAKKTKDKTASLLKEAFPNPLNIANQYLTQIEQKIPLSNSDIERSVLSRIAKEYKETLAEKESFLQCETPDFEAWEKVFSDSLEENHSILDACVKWRFNELIALNEWDSEEVAQMEKTDFWLKQKNEYAEYCKHNVDRRIEAFFDKDWISKIKPCTERLMHLSAIMSNKTDNITIQPIKNTAPPSIKSVRDKLIVDYNKL